MHYLVPALGELFNKIVSEKQKGLFDYALHLLYVRAIGTGIYYAHPRTFAEEKARVNLQELILVYVAYNCKPIGLKELVIVDEG